MLTQNRNQATPRAPGTWAAHGIPNSAAAGPWVALLVSHR